MVALTIQAFSLPSRMNFCIQNFYLSQMNFGISLNHRTSQLINPTVRDVEFFQHSCPHIYLLHGVCWVLGIIVLFFYIFSLMHRYRIRILQKRKKGFMRSREITKKLMCLYIHIAAKILGNTIHLMLNHQKNNVYYQLMSNKYAVFVPYEVYTKIFILKTKKERRADFKE